jgi:hypothetical protein
MCKSKKFHAMVHCHFNILLRGRATGREIERYIYRERGRERERKRINIIELLLAYIKLHTVYTLYRIHYTVMSLVYYTACNRKEKDLLIFAESEKLSAIWQNFVSTNF